MDNTIRKDIYYTAIIKGLHSLMSSIRGINDKYRFGKDYNLKMNHIIDLQSHIDDKAVLKVAEYVKSLIDEVTSDFQKIINDIEST